MLHILGLSPVEQHLYEALVSHGPATHAELTALVSTGRTGGQDRAEHTDTTPEAALDAALDRLRRLRLLTDVRTDPPRYSATPPHLALDALLAARLHRLARAHQRMLDLSTRFHHSPAGADALVEVVHGPEAIVRLLAVINAGIRHEVLGLDRPPYFGDQRQGNILPNDQPRPDLSVRTMFRPDGMKIVGLSALLSVAAGLQQVRVGEVPVKLFLVDNRLCVMLLDHATDPVEALLVVHDPHLLRVLRALFELCWEHAVDVHVRADGTESRDLTRPPDDARTLLGLLASGLTNDAIAAQLGWSQRTVRRRVKDLMRELGAETRFQAGYQAVMRGWFGAFEEFTSHDTAPAPRSEVVSH